MKPKIPPSAFRTFLLLSCAPILALAQPKVSVVTAMPVSSMTPGQAVMLAVTTSESPVSYQWKRDGVNLPGATASSYSISMVGAADRGGYQVVVTGPSGTTTTDMGSMAVGTSDARLINLSARAMVGMGPAVMIAGFVSQGDANSTNKNILMRGMGPALGGMGGMSAAGVLTNPSMTVYDGQSRPMASNMGWMNGVTRVTGSGSSSLPVTVQPATLTMMSAMGAFAPGMGSSDSALMMSAPFGPYTMVVSGANNSSGIALAECYDADATVGNGMNTARLANMSARANVGTGANGLVAGFVVTAGPSGAPCTVVLRAMGPALAAMGVTGILTNPSMTLYDANSKPIANNSGWTTAPVMAAGTGASPMRTGIEAATLDLMSRVGAFPPASASADCAMIATLSPGAYSVAVSGLPDASGNPTSGVALVEIYEMR